MYARGVEEPEVCVAIMDQQRKLGAAKHNALRAALPKIVDNAEGRLSRCRMYLP